MYSKLLHPLNTALKLLRFVKLKFDKSNEFNDSQL